MNHAIRGLAIVIAFVPFVAMASHYDLTSIDLVEGDSIARLAKLNIFTTEDLWKATKSPAQISKLAKKIGVRASKLREWHDFCDLLRISGIGPKVARILTMAGVKRVENLAAQEPSALTETIKSTNAQVGILGKLPDEDTVRAWIDQARNLMKSR